MKRATALQVLAATLVVLTVASAVPVAYLLVQETATPAGPSSPRDGASPSSQGAATHGLPFGPAGNPDASSPGDGAGSLGGTSSRPGVSGAAARGTGSALLDQVLGAARLMGIEDVQVPDLPLHKLDTVDPLKAAILGWIATTNAQVPPDELARELARADALPLPLQRDLAILILAATEATILQREATAVLTPEQLAWVHAHPELASMMAEGIVTPETHQLAALAALVDTRKSIEASLLLLTAVEATRGSLADPAAAEGLATLQGVGDLDPLAQALLRALSNAGAQATDQEKVRFAAELVAITSGGRVPAPVAAESFQDAVLRLAAATGQTPDPDALPAVLARAEALPDDLERAVASLVLAQALAVESAAPSRATPATQGEAMARVLATVADVLPILEKHSLYWANAPDALRVGQWSPQMRIGWAVEHAAYFVSTGGEPADVVRAASLLHGTGLQDVAVPQLSFVDAYVALASESLTPPNATMVAEVRDASSLLDARVQRAAAILMSGAAESARLQREAYADLAPAELAELLDAPPLDALLLDPTPSQADVDQAARISRLAAKVDRGALARAQLVALESMTQARDVLEALETQGDAQPLAGGLAGLLQRLVPWQTARAQGSVTCVPLGGSDAPFGLQLGIATNDCENDVYLRIADPFFGGFAFSVPNLAACTPLPPANGRPAAPAPLTRCPPDPNSALERDSTLLLITGPSRTVSRPAEAFRCVDPDVVLPRVAPNNFSVELRFRCGGFFPVPAFGAPVVTLDLGGNDAWQRPVAVTMPAAYVPVSLHLDMGGADLYADATEAYDERSYLWNLVAGRDGHPTQGAAVGGGVAILLDNGLPESGADQYDAPSLSQGYGQWGLGLLVDTAGDDEYSGVRFVQGASGRDLNLGSGILLDLTGADTYAATTGHGYGLGGALVDLGGADTYVNEHPATGAPVVHLTILPGGNLTTLHQREDNRVWLDGPAELNLGLAVDTETSVRPRESDDDLYNDFVETVLGTDPKDREDNPQTHPTAQAEKLAADADNDTYPDFIERALSTDPHDDDSYPLGLPVGPTFLLPAPVGPVDGSGATGAAPVGMKGSDKVIDLRVPLADAGSIDFACAGPVGVIPSTTGESAMNASVGPIATKRQDPNMAPPDGPCLLVGYDPRAPGDAKMPGATVPVNTEGAGNDGTFKNATLRFPAGILALGDVVPTAYDVDYFVVVDLGGNDTFRNAAGGGLAVEREPDAGEEHYRVVAPSLALNVDVGGRQVPNAELQLENPDGAMGEDRYLVPADGSGAYSQGSVWGVLVDTQGDDAYEAGNASQGALGGILLDLKGADRYTAGALSQGATLIGKPTPTAEKRSQAPLPDGGATPADQLSSTENQNDRAARRAVPAFHLDLGDGDDHRVAGSLSQGYARGFGGASGFEDSIVGAAILLDAGGDDVYITNTNVVRGVHTQGVATDGGIALLVDLEGADRYQAWGVVSQGAPIGQLDGNANRDTSRSNVGLAGLLDLGGEDAYEYQDRFGTHDRSAARQDNLTIERGELASRLDSTSAWSSAYLDVGVHYDGENVSLDAIFGSGDKPFTSLDPKSGQDPTKVDGLYVDMPGARLAIGGPQNSTYAREYALVVDLGGANRYRMNAGGLIVDPVARREIGDEGVTGGHDLTVPLFPVSFVLDAGTGGSLYEASRGLVQGAGFFSVGVLVDLGGHDRFVTLPVPLPELSSAWARVEPTIDGSLAEPLWTGIDPTPVILVGANDTRFAENFTIRVANDASAIYFAIEGHTMTADAAARVFDDLRISLNPGRKLTAASGTPIDETNLTLKLPTCTPHDWHFDAALRRLERDADAAQNAVARCSVTGDTFTIEIARLLGAGNVRDPQDLDLAYDERTGFRKADAQAGFRIAFTSEAAGDEFVWPAGSQRIDGGGAYLRNSDLGDEIRGWATLALASQGQAGVPAPLTLAPSLSQGAAVAGVGVLAHLGTAASSNTYLASDKAQGYASFRGLGLLVDAGGSDLYNATTSVQGFGGSEGAGVLVDVEGNDNYRSLEDSLGATGPAGNALGLFTDLGGQDEYDVDVPAGNAECAGNDTATCRVAMPTELGPAVIWRQNNGVGADYLSNDDVRTNLRALYANDLYGASRARVQVETTDTAGDCTGSAATETIEGREAYVLSGLVCIVTVVDLSGGADPASGVVIDVDGLDLMVGGHRFATIDVADAIEELEDRVYRFTTKFDTNGLEDGSTRIGAVPILRATFPQDAAGVPLGKRGAVVFYDHAAGASSQAGVLVNNPSITALKLWPEFEGGADAVVSPNSVFSHKRDLLIDWTASHDAGEDRYGLVHGWSAPPALSNVPCGSDPAKLCDLLPFYLSENGKEVSTEPQERIPLPSNAFRQEAGTNQPYVQIIPPLETNVTLKRTDAFHLALNTHLSLLPGKYTTKIQVSLTNEAGKKIFLPGGDAVTIASAERTTVRSLGVQDLASTFATVYGQYTGTVKPGIENTNKQLNETGVLGVAVTAIHTSCPGNTVDPTATAWDAVYGAKVDQAFLPCMALYGDPSVQRGTGICRRISAWDGTPQATAYRVQEAWNANNPFLGRPPCTPHVIHLLNETAKTNPQVDAPVVGPVGPGPIADRIAEAVDGAAETYLVVSESGDLNWNDFFLDARQPNLPAGRAPFAEDAESDTITIPPGYGLMLEMYIDSDGIPLVSEMLGSPTFFSDAWHREVIYPLYDQLAANRPTKLDDGGEYQTANATARTACEARDPPKTNCLYTAVSPADGVYNDTALTQVGQQKSETGNVGWSIDQRKQNPIPIALFYYGDAQSSTGEPQIPARLELRVPTEPGAQAIVTLEDVISVPPLAIAELYKGPVVGDVDGSPTRGGIKRIQQWEREGEPPTLVLVDERIVYEPQRVVPASGPIPDASLRFTENRLRFDGTLPDGSLLPDGTYRINVTTWDNYTGKLDTRFSTFVLDRVAPTTRVPGGFAGAATLQGNLIPVRWATDEQGSGLLRTWVFAANGASGGFEPAKRTASGVPWNPETDAFPGNVRQYLHVFNGRTRDYHFVTVAQDIAGNLEYDVVPTPTVNCVLGSLNIAPGSLDHRVCMAAKAKIEAGEATEVIVDKTVPGVRGEGIAGARLASHQGIEFPFVQAGADVAFEACARDSDGSNVQAVFFQLSLLGAPDAVPRSLEASPSGSCEDGMYRWSFGGWGAENPDKDAWPDGVWTVAVQAYDRASNPTKVGMGSLILDSVAPQIRLEDPIFPPGQSAVKAGDRLTLRLLAVDAFGVDDAAIRIDASALSKQGALATRPVRISGLVYQEASVTVDRTGLRNGNVTLDVHVRDNAGNLNVTSFTIPVDFKTFVIPATSVSVSNVTHNSTVVRWTTTEPTTSQVRFGVSPLDLKTRSPLDATLTTTHEVKVEGLAPSTRYYLRAVSSTAGGFVNESDVLEAATGSALFLEPLAPAAGAPLRGLVDVRFRGGLLDGADFVAFTLEAQAGEGAPWTFVTTTTESTGEHSLVFNSTRFLDGAGYRLRLTAEAGKDKLSATLGPFLADNSAPRIIVVSPLVATNSTTPRLIAEGQDPLARFGADAATLLIDGQAVTGLVAEARDDRIAITHDVAAPLAPGAHAFELQLRDRAGNVAVETWTVKVDGDAPVLTANPTSYSPGRAAAKLGGTATLNITVTDASGLQEVVADTSAISSQATTSLSRVTGTDRFVGTFPVTDAAPDATRAILVTATDLAGNSRATSVEVPVDNVAPVVSEVRTSDVSQTRASLIADASEPIVLMGRVAATGAPVVEASGERFATHAVLPLSGLLPSRTYQFTLQAVDRAGNAVDLAGRFQTALDTVPPTRVAGLTILDLLDGSLRLSWAAASDEVGVAAYRVYRSEDGGASFRPIAEVAGLVYRDVNLPLETRFVYQVVAVDHGGNEGAGSERLAAQATAVPRLTGGTVSPTLGSTATVFRYVVTYVSPGKVAPAYVHVLLDGTAQEMTLQPGGSPATGLVYAYETRLAAHKRDAPHTYSFEASDGRYTALFPDSGEILRGPLVSGDASAGPAGSVVAFAQRVPLLGAAGLTLALGIAAVAVTALLRRKNS